MASSLFDELAWRGLLYQATPNTDERLASGPVTAYCGYDPTAASLQIGNLVPTMLLAHLQRHGHRPIVLIGGATALIGDPSGKQAERPLLDPSEVHANAERQATQLARFLDFSGDTGATVINNAEWLSEQSLLHFLRDTGKHFTVSYMLQKESVKTRLESGISFTEFSYMVLQAYDFLHLYRSAGCELQVGGSDQWGNITAGAELIRRVAGGEAHGFCAPLLTTASGAKFGKTESGAVWLDGEMTSPYQFFQFLLNIDDRDVSQLLRYFTFLSRDDIDGLVAASAEDPGGRSAQRALARDLTSRVHGEEVCARVERAAAVLFGGFDPREADVSVLETLAREIDTASVATDASVLDVLVATGVAKSKGDARRGIEQGGMYLNQQRIDADRNIDSDDWLAGGYLLVRRGAKTYGLARAAP